MASIFQRDFAVKQDYPEIIKPEIIKVLLKKQRYGCSRCHGNETEVPGNKDIKKTNKKNKFHSFKSSLVQSRKG